MTEADQGIKVAFVCTGNICRSPMAEAVFANLVQDKKLQHKIIKIDSFGTDAYHVGQDPDYRTQEVCEKYSVPIAHYAQQIRKKHFDEFDYIICMDKYNLRSLERKKPKDAKKGNIYLFGNWREDKKFDIIVDDPYYGGKDGFEVCYRQCIHFSEVFFKRELQVSA